LGQPAAIVRLAGHENQIQPSSPPLLAHALDCGHQTWRTGCWLPRPQLQKHVQWTARVASHRPRLAFKRFATSSQLQADSQLERSGDGCLPRPPGLWLRLFAGLPTNPRISHVFAELEPSPSPTPHCPVRSHPPFTTLALGVESMSQASMRGRHVALPRKQLNGGVVGACEASITTAAVTTVS